MGDELISAIIHVLLFATNDRNTHRFNIVGVTVTPANSWWKSGTSATRKILRIFRDSSSDGSGGCGDRQLPPVAESTLAGTNAFPDGERIFNFTVLYPGIVVLYIVGSSLVFSVLIFVFILSVQKRSWYQFSHAISQYDTEVGMTI